MFQNSAALQTLLPRVTQTAARMAAKPPREAALPLSQLHQVADVFNIEGGHCAAQLKAENPHAPQKVWANLAVIIDRPILEKRTLGDISKGAETKKFKLKESLVSDYNESAVNLAYLTVSRWYLQNIHRIAGIPADRQATVTFQIHRAKSALPQARLIKDMLLANLADCHELTDKPESDLCSLSLQSPKVQAEFRNVNEHGTDDCCGYENADALVSLSLVGGLSHHLVSGSLVLPSKFIPMDTDKPTLCVRSSASYEADNHLCSVLPEVLASQRPEDIQLANGRFASPNPDKKNQSTQALTVGDFNEVALLQINTIWNPRNPDQVFQIEQPAPSQAA